MERDINVDLARMQERIVLLQSSLEKAHVRMDGIQKDLRDELKQISADLKTVVAYMNQTQGSKVAVIGMVSMAIALLGALAKIFLK